MRISLRRLSDERHRLDIVREDGSRDGAELETRSLLLHDLVHYAVEAEAPLAEGFWGLLAGGTSLADLADRARPGPLSADQVLAERLVGPLQSLMQGRLSEPRWRQATATMTLPFAVDGSFPARVRARLRALTGAWQATPWGGRLVLVWPASEPPRVEPAGR
jgi:hypothetical protein